MRYTVVLPAGLTEAGADFFTLAVWRKEIGELVQQGETIATVRPLNTDAAGKEIEVFSPAYGILARKTVLEGDGIETGEPLGVLSGVPEALPTTPPTPTAFAAPSYVPAGPEETVTRSATEALMALHNARSLRTSPHVTTVATVNLSEVLRLRERVAASLTEREGIVLDILPFVLSVVGATLLEYPLLNAQLREKDGEIRLRRYVNLAFVVPLEEGQIAVPVIRSPEKMSTLGLARTVDDLKTRAQGGALHADELHGATFTVTQVAASEGVLWQTPIIHQPQSAMLSIGAVVKTPVALADETIAIRPLLHLCLAHDARTVDNEMAAAFLASVKRGLEDGQFLFS